MRGARAVGLDGEGSGIVAAHRQREGQRTGGGADRAGDARFVTGDDDGHGAGRHDGRRDGHGDVLVGAGGRDHGQRGGSGHDGTEQIENIAVREGAFVNTNFIEADIGAVSDSLVGVVGVRLLAAEDQVLARERCGVRDFHR